jgi:hypothetical protein
MYNINQPNVKDLLKDTLHDMSEFLKNPENKNDPDYELMQETYDEIDAELRQILEEESYKNEDISDQLIVIYKRDEGGSFS